MYSIRTGEYELDFVFHRLDCGCDTPGLESVNAKIKAQQDSPQD